jgi:DNA-binding NarL/FixJ family response regulator
LPEVRVLVLISDVEDPRAIRLLGQGAAGFLTKDAPLEQLLVAIAEVHAGGSYLAPALAKRLDGALPPGVRRKPHHLLSDREYQVMVLLCSGKTPTRIAEELGLSVKTVSTYRTRTCAKMGFTNKTDLLVYGLREGLVG